MSYHARKRVPTRRSSEVTILRVLKGENAVSSFMRMTMSPAAFSTEIVPSSARSIWPTVCRDATVLPSVTPVSSSSQVDWGGRLRVIAGE